MDAGKIWVQLGLDIKEFEQGIKKVEKRLVSVGQKMQSIGKTMSLTLTLPILAAGAASFKYASDLDEAMSKTNEVFKGSAKEVQKWSKTTLTNLGISQGAALDAASLFGDMATSMGLVPSVASDMSMSLVALGADLASFKNISVKQTSTALKGIFTGETEALKTLGVVMTQQQLETYALANGYTKLMNDMTQAELVQLRYNFVMDATSNAQGDFARTSDGAANQMRIFTESLKEAAASFGQLLLPIITPMIQKVNIVMAKIAALSEEQKKWILSLAGIAAAIGPVLIVTGKFIQLMPSLHSGLISVVKVVGKMTKALMANPYLAAAAAIVLLLGILYTYGKTQEDLKKEWESLKKAWADTRAFEQIMGVFKEIFGGIWEIVTNVITVFQDLLSVFGIGSSAASSFETIISGLLVTMKLATVPLRLVIKLVSTLTGAVKGVVDIFKDWKNLSIEGIFNRIGDGIRDLVQNNPIADLGRSIKQVFVGAAEDSGSFQDAMKFDFNEMKRTAKEAAVTIEDMAQSFADSFEGMSDSQRASIKAVRLEYLKSVEEWIDGTVAKMKAEGFLNQSLAAQTRALDQFVKDSKSKMDIAIAEITSAGGPKLWLPDEPTENAGAETPEEKHKKALEQIQQEYKRAIALSSTYQQKLEAELKSINDEAEAFRQLALIGGYDETEIGIMQAYQLSIDEVIAKLQELENQKKDLAAHEAFKESLKAEIQSIREALLTEEEMIKKSWSDRKTVIEQAMAEGILTLQEGTALIEQITAEYTKALQENTKGVKTWANSWTEASTQIEDALDSTVEDMAMSAVEMLASGKGMASVGLMIMSAFAEMAIQVGKIAVGTAIAVGGIKEALKSLDPFVAAGAGLALIALGGFVKSQLANVGDMQGLATGGIVTSGGVFKVGEEGEELVTLPRGSAVTPNHMLQGNQQGGYIVSTRIAGRDLEILLERSAAQTKRR